VVLSGGNIDQELLAKILK